MGVLESRPDWSDLMIWFCKMQTGGSPNKEDLATSTSDQELDAGNSGVALLLLTLLPMFHLFSELETFDPNGSSCFT